LGLHRLGHEVLFLEESDDYPSCYDPTTHQVGTDPTYGLSFAKRAFSELGIGSGWAYYDAHQKRWRGPAAEMVDEFCGDADALIDVSGVNRVLPVLQHIPIRILIDTDPAFTQIRHLTNEAARSRASQHNVFFSFGEAIETGESTVPDDGFHWHATRQPVVLDVWPRSDGPNRGAFTTVMQWESYLPVEFDGRRFGMKSESFNMVRDVPSRTAAPLEIALGGTSAPRHQLVRLGWRVVDPLSVTRDPWTYQMYLQQSRGEFSIAKHGYVVTRSGWFSERTACYLATGRPVIIQDTGFSQFIPCGEGIFAFDDAESALASIYRAEGQYQKHCGAARELAEAYFGSDKVLDSLLARAISAVRSSSRA
ncbi:MAG TPA: hypothetical protein VFW73_13775, partial [Lacipirellulaceae bacterium]|nr:hypothetical protein [Lacipirellulaceae bacterium]